MARVNHGFYKIDESKKIVETDFASLSAEQRKVILDLKAVGYTIIDKKKRSGVSHSEASLTNQLSDDDKARFQEIKSAQGFPKARSYASAIVKLGKLYDNGEIGLEEMNEYRELSKTDTVLAKIFSEACLKAKNKDDREKRIDRARKLIDEKMKN